jgi:ribosomal-protein-alanine N-acetyltransferase
MNLTTKKYFPAMTVGLYDKKIVIDFLYQHLDEYGDSEEAISKCVEYALNAGSHPGGLIISVWDDNKIVGASVINKTGMEGYIPENILVYIAIDKEYRGKGIGKMLMDKVMSETNGDIALHVEPNNPAKFLYEKLGFENKYLEMRWKRK